MLTFARPTLQDDAIAHVLQMRRKSDQAAALQAMDMLRRLERLKGKAGVVPFLSAVWSSTSFVKMYENHRAAALLVEAGCVWLVYRRPRGQQPRPLPCHSMLDYALAPKTVGKLPRGWERDNLALVPMMITENQRKLLKPLTGQPLMESH